MSTFQFGYIGGGGGGGSTNIPGLTQVNSTTLTIPVNTSVPAGETLRLSAPMADIAVGDGVVGTVQAGCLDGFAVTYEVTTAGQVEVSITPTSTSGVTTFNAATTIALKGLIP